MYMYINYVIYRYSRRMVKKKDMETKVIRRRRIKNNKHFNKITFLLFYLINIKKSYLLYLYKKIYTWLVRCQ